MTPIWRQHPYLTLHLLLYEGLLPSSKSLHYSRKDSLNVLVPLPVSHFSSRGHKILTFSISILFPTIEFFRCDILFYFCYTAYDFTRRIPTVRINANVRVSPLCSQIKLLSFRKFSNTVWRFGAKRIRQIDAYINYTVLEWVEGVSHLEQPFSQCRNNSRNWETWVSSKNY